MHSRDIRKSTGPFTILQDPKIRIHFLSQLSSLIKSLNFTLFITCIQKIPYSEKYGNHARNPYDIALEYTFERILHFMESNNQDELPVIAEARGGREDDALRASFHRLLSEGTRYNHAERFQKLNCPISFRQKRDNICGIQLADLCAYPTARYILKTQQPNQAFECIRPHFYQKGNVYGLKIYPK